MNIFHITQNLNQRWANKCYRTPEIGNKIFIPACNKALTGRIVDALCFFRHQKHINSHPGNLDLRTWNGLDLFCWQRLHHILCHLNNRLYMYHCKPARYFLYFVSVKVYKIISQNKATLIFRVFIFFIFIKSTFLFESSQIHDQQNTLRLVCKFTISLKKCNMTIKYSVYILRCSNSCQGLRDTNYRTMIPQSLSYKRFVPVIVCTGSHSFM